MKKILAFILLITFLFLTSCDKDASADESSNETATSTEETIDENEEREYYQSLNDKDHTANYMSGQFFESMPQVYTSYQEMITSINGQVVLDDDVSEEVFNDNYVLVNTMIFNDKGYKVKGYYDFAYDEINNKMSISVDISRCVEGSYTQGKQTLCYVLVITKELFPKSVEQFPSEITVNENIEQEKIEDYKYYLSVLKDKKNLGTDIKNISKIVYTSHQEFVDDMEYYGIELNNNFNEEIFQNNYLLLTHIWVGTGGYDVYGYHKFQYDEANNKMSITADVMIPQSGDIVTMAEENFYHINIIPKELFPEDVSKIPNEIQIEWNK